MKRLLVALIFFSPFSWAMENQNENGPLRRTVSQPELKELRSLMDLTTHEQVFAKNKHMAAEWAKKSWLDHGMETMRDQKVMLGLSLSQAVIGILFYMIYQWVQPHSDEAA